MDFIKKTICLEGARTRTQGLMPYYEFGKVYESHDAYDSNGNPICYKPDEIGLESASGENGNWGQFVANPCFLAKEDKTYETMLYKYYALLNIVRNSTKLRKIKPKNGGIIYTEDMGAFVWGGECFSEVTEPDFLYEYAAYDAKYFQSTAIESTREKARHIYRTDVTVDNDHNFLVIIEDYDKFLELASYLDDTDYSDVGVQSGIIENANEHEKWAEYCKVVDICIGKINLPSWIYNEHIKVPKSMACSDVEPYINWLTNYQTLSADCCNARLWDDMGGEIMLKYLQQSAKTKCNEYSDAIDGLEYSIPYLEMPLLLVQNYTDVGVMTNIDGVEYDGNATEKERPHGIGNQERAFTIDQIVMGSERNTYSTDGDDTVIVESLLETLRSRKKYTDDRDNVLPGLFEKFDGKPEGQMYSCVKMGDEKFYELTTSSYTVPDKIVDGEMTYKTLYAVVYIPTTNENIVGMNNRMDTYTRVFDGKEGLETQEEADAIVAEQRDSYDGGDPSYNESHYRISVYEEVWTMSALTSFTPNQSKNADGYLSGDKLSGDEGLKYPPSDPYENPVNKFYRTITTEAAGIRIAETEEEETGQPDAAKTHYFFCVKYNNSPSVPMRLPYTGGNVTNMYAVPVDNEDEVPTLYRGDFILPGYPMIIGNEIIVEYVVGGYFRADEKGNFLSYVGSGDVYYEKYSYEPSHVDYVALDGVDNVPVWSEYIDFNGAAKEFYSPRYDLYRTGNTANIIEMVSGEQWVRKDGEGNAYSYDAYLTKEDYLINFSLPPKTDVNVTIDRGGVSAFEKHYKLSECNTMQDLENYGNNFFNI